MRILKIASFIMLVGIVFSCSKTESQVAEEPALLKKAQFTDGQQTLDVSLCPEPEDDCCAAPAGNCGPAGTVIAGVAAELEGLVSGGQNGNDNTEEIRDFFATRGSSDLDLSSDLLDYIADSEGLLKMEVYVNGSKSYYKIFEDGILIFVIPITIV